MSTGMGSKEEIAEALEAIHEMGNDQVAILKCSSAYPAISDDMHLKTIADMKQTFDIPVGLSDHSMGHLGATTAVALGANIIEKHFCISRAIENPDSSFSMEPAEFKEMVDQIRQVEKAMGNVFYGVSKQEQTGITFRRSIFVTKDLKKGDVLSMDNVRIIRPGYGEKPKYLDDILGMKIDRDVEWGTPFSFDMLCKGSILLLTGNKDRAELCEKLKVSHPDKEIYCIINKVTLDLIQKMQPETVMTYHYKHDIPDDVQEYMNGRILDLA